MDVRKIKDQLFIFIETPEDIYQFVTNELALLNSTTQLSLNRLREENKTILDKMFSLEKELKENANPQKFEELKERVECSDEKLLETIVQMDSKLQYMNAKFMKELNQKLDEASNMNNSGSRRRSEFSNFPRILEETNASEEKSATLAKPRFTRMRCKKYI